MCVCARTLCTFYEVNSPKQSFVKAFFVIIFARDGMEDSPRACHGNETGKFGSLQHQYRSHGQEAFQKAGGSARGFSLRPQEEADQF